MRRAEIRRKAAELFAKNGYHATGVQELSEAVGLGRGALYHHIGSKEELLYEISVAQVDEMLAHAQAVLAQPGTAEDKLRLLSATLMRKIAEHRAEWTVFFREVGALSGERRATVLARRDRYEAIWAEVVDRGVRAREFRPLDPIAIKGLLGMHNYSYLWLREGGRLAPEEISQVFCDALLRGLRAEERPVAPGGGRRRVRTGAAAGAD